MKKIQKSDIQEAREFVINKLKDYNYHESYPQEAEIFETILVALGNLWNDIEMERAFIEEIKNE